MAGCGDGATCRVPLGARRAGRGRLPLGRASDARGWVIDSPRLLGVKHFRHLSPRPAGYRYLYPDFFQVVYGAQAHRFDPGGRERGGYELGAEFQPTAQVQRQPLYPSERLFLAAALAGVSSS